jgi:hypothetical protein
MIADTHAAQTVQVASAQNEPMFLFEVISECVQSSEAICDGIAEFIDWETASYEETVKQRGKDSENGGEEEDDIDETRVRFAALDRYIEEIDSLAGRLGGLAAANSTNAGKTLAAAREYFKMLSECSADLKTICDYYLDLYNAVYPIGSFEPPESTTGEEDYSLFAGQLSQVVSQSQTLLKKISVPSHIAASHDDLVKRVDEFQAFCQDFSKSVQLSDPLRLYSCIYRMSRLSTMLDKNGYNIDDDIDLQFRHAKDRLDGSISLLRNELKQNIELLSL